MQREANTKVDGSEPGWPDGGGCPHFGACGSHFGAQLAPPEPAGFPQRAGSAGCICPSSTPTEPSAFPQRASSCPNSARAAGQQTVVLQSVPAGGDARRKHRRKSPDESLVRAVTALTATVERLGHTIQSERTWVAAREDKIISAMEKLAVFGAGADAGGSGSGPAPLAKGSGPLQLGAIVEGSHEDSSGDLGGFAGGAPDPQERLLQVLSRLEEHFSRRQQDSVNKARCDRRRGSEAKETLVGALREMVQAVQNLNRPEMPLTARPYHSQSEPRYRPYIGRDGRLHEFPEVEVSLKLYQVCNVNTSQLTFEVDFVCHLDWQDQNVEGKTSEELQMLDWTAYFNPHVEIDNGKDNHSWLDGVDAIPRRRRRVSGEGERCGGSVRHALGPWLRKTMRFRGILSLSSVNLKCFPFDRQLLPIKLKAARCRGLALSTPAAVPGTMESVSLVHLVDSQIVQTEEAYKGIDQRRRGQGHYAVNSADDSLMEFTICGLSGHHPDPKRCDIYEVSVAVTRPLFASYFWDMVIMNLFVLLAATAFWDTAAPELSSRMSISLTIILTLAAYTSSRPAPIEKAPYVTFHDWAEQVSMFLVTGISMQSVVAVVMCGGQHEEAPPYMQEEFARNEEQCSVGWCYSRNIDCQALIVLLVLWGALAAYSCMWLYKSRRHATKQLRVREQQAQQAKDLQATSQSIKSSDSLGSWSGKLRRWCGRHWARCAALTRCCCRAPCCCSRAAAGDEALAAGQNRPLAGDDSPISPQSRGFEDSPVRRPRPSPLGHGLEASPIPSSSPSPTTIQPASSKSGVTLPGWLSTSPARAACAPSASSASGLPRDLAHLAQSGAASSRFGGVSVSPSSAMNSTQRFDVMSSTTSEGMDGVSHDALEQLCDNLIE